MKISENDSSEAKEITNSMFIDEFLKKDDFKYSDIPIKRTTEVNLHKPIHDVMEYLNFKPLKVNKICSIWKCSLGVGHEMFIVYNNGQNVISGSEDVVLRSIDYEYFSKNVLDGTKATLTIQDITKKPKNDITIEGLFNMNKFFVTEESIREDVLKHVVLTYGFRKILDDFLCERAEIDERILFAMKTKLLTFGNNVKPEYQKYNDHTMIISNTKTGKSTLLEKTCGNYKFGRSTASRLLGFAGSEKSKVYKGALADNYKPIALDEFTTAGYKDDTLGTVATILETGNDNIGTGCETLNIKNSSTFIVATNVDGRDIPADELALDMEKCINRLSQNSQRFGSRVALDLFGNDFKPVKQYGVFNRADFKIASIIAKTTSNKLSGILLETINYELVEKWLNKQIKEFSEQVLTLVKGTHLSHTVRDYWKSKIDGYRHIRGMALKSGLIEYACEEPLIIFDNKIDLQKLILYSEKELKKIINLNLESLQKMVNINMEHAEYFKARFKDLPVYQKILVLAIIDHYKNTDGISGKIIEFEDVSSEVKLYGQRFDNDKYSHISGFLQAITKLKNIDVVNNAIKPFNIELRKSDDKYKIISHNTISELEIIGSGISGVDS